MGLMVYLLYLAIDMKRIEYVITGEQLIYKHGVLFHTADFMELYRIVDYQEHRTPMQQIIGLKNVTLLSGDRSMPRLTMTGIRSSSRILEEIRTRVEYNKKRRGIYEITNRF
jgi:membrane protein YdbS with pleckstrin-like domain